MQLRFFGAFKDLFSNFVMLYTRNMNARELII